MFNKALELIKIIENNGFIAYIVGGYPRDLYLNIPSIDIDICTNATPMDLKKIFNDVKISNELYGSVRLIYKDIRFEITTFRKEKKYIDNRHPSEIVYINDLYEDLLRRDFTINTLCIDKTGTTIDLLNSKNDLDNKLIKVVGNTKEKIENDSLRILRAIRFATILNFKLDKQLKKYIKKYGYLLKKLSYNRKKEELDKIFSSSNAIYGIDLIRSLKLDKHLELKNINKVVYTSSLIGIWAQMNVSSIYPFSNNEKKLINDIHDLLNKNILDLNILYKYGPYICSIVAEIKGIDKRLITIEYDNLYIKSKSDIDITAFEICNLFNKPKGLYLKMIYNDLEYQLINKLIINKKEELIKYLKNKYLT